MRKIDRSIENPFDNILLDISEEVSPFFKATNHTPNLITFYSAISAVISMYFLYNKSFFLFSCTWILSYFFDSLDGYFARKYDMVSKLGDKLDHGKDTLMWIITGIILYKKYNIPRHVFLVFVIICIFCIKQIGCQQNLYTESKIKESINFYSRFCKTPSDISFTRFFGGGSVYLFIILMVYVGK
jgi:hypothetical protein